MRQLLDKVVDVPEEVPLLVRVVDVPVVQADRGVDVFFFGVKGVGDVLAGVEQGVVDFLVGVKGVGDVLAGRWSRVLWSSSFPSRASMMCWRSMEQGVVELFAGVKGVRDVLAEFWSWVLVPGEEVIFLPTHTVCIVEYRQVQLDMVVDVPVIVHVRCLVQMRRRGPAVAVLGQGEHAGIP